MKASNPARLNMTLCYLGPWNLRLRSSANPRIRYLFGFRFTLP
jgi:hypothetical protein